MDGRPNVDIKPRFQISPAWCGRDLRISLGSRSAELKKGSGGHFYLTCPINVFPVRASDLLQLQCCLFHP